MKLSKSKGGRDQQLFVSEGPVNFLWLWRVAIGWKRLCVLGNVRQDNISDVLDSIPKRPSLRYLRLYSQRLLTGKFRWIVAMLKPKSHKLADIQLSENPFLILLESVEKPGKLGAVLRTAMRQQPMP